MPAPEERKCQLKRGAGYCLGTLRHCYTRIGQKWTKVGHFCEMCGNFKPQDPFMPVRPGGTTHAA